MKTTTQNKLGLNGEIEKWNWKKKTSIKGLTKKIRNQKNKDQIKKYNILQTRIEGLEWKEIKILCKSQWTKIKNQKKKDQITSTKTQRRLINNFLKRREKRRRKKKVHQRQTNHPLMTHVAPTEKEHNDASNYTENG